MDLAWHIAFAVIFDKVLFQQCRKLKWFFIFTPHVEVQTE
ncbi:MAG: hypothetical protein BWY72_00192 [Bacteroidetes bacterium ADurb.Bin416]|nr:MAG: hypothetical protein BWY72_00192 [Bacteroidetes bacterium ADurb.Bin416]